MHLYRLMTQAIFACLQPVQPYLRVLRRFKFGSQPAARFRLSSPFVVFNYCAGSDCARLHVFCPDPTVKRDGTDVQTPSYAWAITEVNWCSLCNRATRSKTSSAVRPSRSPVGSSASRTCGWVMARGPGLGVAVRHRKARRSDDGRDRASPTSCSQRWAFRFGRG